MKRIYLATGALLLSATFTPAAWMAAQQPAAKSAPQTSSQNQEQDKAKSETTIQGCLSGAGGSFSLTDKSGKAYQLEGDAAKLGDHVGHEVQLIGTQSGSGDSASSTQTTFTVKKLKMLAASCSK
jgi:hypothetical protein